MSRNNSTNALRHPYLRNDLWANGYFDFLFKPFMSESYRKRLMTIKEQARAEQYIKTDRVHFEKMKGRIKNTF